MQDILNRTDVGTIDFSFFYEGNPIVSDLAAFLAELSEAALASEVLGHARVELVDFNHGSLRLHFVARIKNASRKIALYEKPTATLASAAVVASFLGHVALQFIPGQTPPTPLVRATCKLVLGEGALRIELAATGENCVIVDRATAKAILWEEERREREAKFAVLDAAYERLRRVAKPPAAPIPDITGTSSSNEAIQDQRHGQDLSGSGALGAKGATRQEHQKKDRPS